MKKTLFTGAGTALITPFTKDGVDFNALGNIIEFQITSGIDSLIICGTTGEAATMPDHEHLSVIDYAVKKAAGRVPIIAGTGSNDTAHCVELSIEAQKLGADGLLISTPYYNKCSQKGLLMHFEQVMANTNLPIIIYNIPGRCGMQFAVSTVCELNKCDQIVGIKEASGSIDYVTQIANACPDLPMYSGNDDMIVPLLSMGGKGVISVLSNVCPKETHDLCQAYFDGNVKESLRLQKEYLDLIHALFCEVNPIPVKTAMHLLGYCENTLRLPLCEPAEENRQKIVDALTAHGLLSGRKAAETK